ncbi:MAG: hypothetical protein ACTSSP_05645 [Candidatus Asgardarchaeia archaeon]
MTIHVNCVIGSIEYSDDNVNVNFISNSGVSEEQLNQIRETILFPFQKKSSKDTSESFIVYKTIFNDTNIYYIAKIKEAKDNLRDFQVIIIDEAAFALIHYDPYFLQKLFTFDTKKGESPLDISNIISDAQSFNVPDSMGDMPRAFLNAIQSLVPPDVDYIKVLKVIIDVLFRKSNFLLATPKSQLIHNLIRGIVYLMPRQLRKDYSFILGLPIEGNGLLRVLISFEPLNFNDFDKLIENAHSIVFSDFTEIPEEKISPITSFVTEMFPKLPSTLFARAKKLEEVLDVAGRIEYDFSLLQKYVMRVKYLDEVGKALSDSKYDLAIDLYYKVLELDKDLGIDYAKSTIDGLRHLLEYIEDDNLKKNTLLHTLEILRPIPEFADVAMDILETGIKTITMDEIKAIFITSFMDRVRDNTYLIISTFELMLTYLEEKLSIVVASHTFGYLNEYLLNLIRRDKTYENVLNELWSIYITYFVRRSLVGALTDSFKALLINKIISNIRNPQVAAAFEHVMRNVVSLMNEIFERERASDDLRNSVFTVVGKSFAQIGSEYITRNRDYLLGLPFYVDGLSYLTTYEDVAEITEDLINRISADELIRIKPIRLVYESLTKIFDYLKKFNLKDIGVKLLDITETVMLRSGVLDNELYVKIVVWYIFTKSKDDFRKFLERTVNLIKRTDIHAGAELFANVIIFLSANNLNDLALEVVNYSFKFLPTKELHLVYKLPRNYAADNIEKYRDLFLLLLSELEKEIEKRLSSEPLSVEDKIILYNDLYEAYHDLEIKDKEKYYSDQIRELVLSAPLNFTPENIETLKVIIERTLTTKEYLREYVARKINYLKSLIESSSLESRRKYGEAMVQITAIIPRIEDILEEESFSSIKNVVDVLIYVANKIESYDKSLGVTAYDALLRFLALQIRHGAVVWNYFKNVAQKRFKAQPDLTRHIQYLKMLVDSISTYEVRDVAIKDVLKYCEKIIKECMKKKDVLLAASLARSIIFSSILTEYLMEKPNKNYCVLMLRLLDTYPGEALRILLASPLMKAYAQRFSDFRRALERRLILLRKTFIYRDQVVRLMTEYNLRTTF